MSKAGRDNIDLKEEAYDSIIQNLSARAGKQTSVKYLPRFATMFFARYWIVSPSVVERKISRLFNRRRHSCWRLAP